MTDHEHHTWAVTRGKPCSTNNLTFRESVDMFTDKIGFCCPEVEPHRRFLTGLAAVNISANTGHSDTPIS